MRVLFLTNIPSPYRVEFFNELGKFCDLTVAFERRTSAERDSSWGDFDSKNFKAIFLKGPAFRVDSAFCPSVIKLLKKNKYDHIVVTNYSDPTGILAIAYMKLLKIPYEIEGDGGFAKSGNGPQEKFKKWLISGATLWFSTSKSHDEYYLQYGAKKEGIVRYPFTSLHEDDIIKTPISAAAKEKIREKLHMKEELIAISVGRFSYNAGYGKGYDLILKASNQTPNIGYYIIGDNPTDEFLDIKKKDNLHNVHFVGFKLPSELKKYYQASDLMLFPTRGEAWGLVINEAMANGLPVITTDKCIAGLELVDDSNGAIIETDSVEQIVESVNKCLSNEELLLSMGKSSIKKIKNYTFEKMAKVHIDFWEKSVKF